MADEDPANRLGFDDSALAFIGDDSGPGNPTSGPSRVTNDNDASQNFFASSGWDFEGSPPYDSYDISAVTACTTSASNPSYVVPAWEVPLFNTQQPRTEVATLEGLAPSLHHDSIFGFSQVQTGRQGPSNSTKRQLTTVPALTPALQEKLRNIAMPPHLNYSSPRSASSPDSAGGDSKNGAISSPDGKHDSRKRKVSAELDDDDEVDDDDKPVKKTAHNMIEKRYRTNINDKISALRDSVPSLRIMSKSARGEDTTEDREELHGLTPAHKLNKATVLSKATEYIRHLEKRNSRLLEENQAMQARIGAFEKLFMAGAMNGSIDHMQQPSASMQYGTRTREHISNPSMDSTDDTHANPVGMIAVPPEMRRILEAQMAVGRPYPVPQQPFRGGNVVFRQQQQQQQQQNGWSNASPYIGKLMVGSLAGLMIIEAFREDEIDSETPDGRGLFALPTQLLKQVASGLDLRLAGYHVHTPLKFLLFLGTFLWIFVPSLFASPKPKQKKRAVVVPQPAPSLASSIQVRRQAWLTAIQSVWVPRHNFFLEAAALLLKTVKLSLRNLIGAPAYQVLTGITPEEEGARVKAWSIALDSQLAGGDVEICKSRLILTLLASGTLPDSPIRLMLKSLHIRVLLWDVDHPLLSPGTVSTIAAKLARLQWNEARRLNRVQAQFRRTNSMDDEEVLPDYLAALVEQECDDVLSPAVIQRAYNLAFNFDTTHDVESRIDGMDTVIDDTAIGSPLDAVAAWWSTEKLHHLLVTSLGNDERALVTQVCDIDLAIEVTPAGSIAQNRAVLAKAILVDKGRGASIAAALEAEKSHGVPSPLNSAISIIGTGSRSPNPDFRLAMQCAMALAHLGRSESSDNNNHRQGLRLIDAIMTPHTASCMSLLGFTAAMKLMEALYKTRPSGEAFNSSLEMLCGNLRLWMSGESGFSCGVDTEVRHIIVDRCLTITKSLVGMEIDTGYGSLSEEDGIL